MLSILGKRSIFGTITRLTKGPLASIKSLSGAGNFGMFRLFSSLWAEQEGFLSGNSANYIDEMWKSWREDPKAVHASWAAFFSGLANGLAPSEAFVLPPNLGESRPSTATSGAINEKDVLDHLKVQGLVRAYRVRGHLAANLDPLSIIKGEETASNVAPELNPLFYGFTEADMDRLFYLGEGVLPNFLHERKQMTLRKILSSLRKVYCQKIGYEYMHIPDRERCQWIRSRIEVPEELSLTSAERQRLFGRLAWASLLERFLMTKYPSDKRFGLEGGESLIPGMIDILYKLSNAGVKSVVLGMAHRGRLNVLTNVVRKPIESVLAEFSGVHDKDTVGTGDVKYHLGVEFRKQMPDGKHLDISLLANPSHLEAVDPVVLGKTRGLQFLNNDLSKFETTVPILIHGDSSFSGQGVVYESLGLADLPHYTVGGTIHLIINNQIGFTTDPRFARSTPYCSDVAKSLNAPIFHVNGDDPEAVIHACRLAADWRIKYKTDVVVDVVCYRRHGHNEMDQPSFTQPRMYKAIASLKPTLDQYTERLLAEGQISKEFVEAESKKIMDHFESHYQMSKTYTPTPKEWVSSGWQGFMTPRELRDNFCKPHATGISIEELKAIGTASSSYPADFKPHPGIKRIMEARIKTIEAGKEIDMPTAETLAFGSLLKEGHHVRLSGQVIAFDIFKV